MSVPPNKYLPEKTWKLMLQSMPIPCVDVIFINNHGEVLYGWRKILPLKNIWALPGGRIIKGESPEQAVLRQAEHYGLSYEKLVLNGVFSMNLTHAYLDQTTRSDILISYAAVGARGNPQPKSEFTKLEWKKEIPEPIISVHRRMVKQWRERQ